jgi:hypothetical protein
MTSSILTSVLEVAVAFIQKKDLGSKFLENVGNHL